MKPRLSILPWFAFLVATAGCDNAAMEASNTMAAGVGTGGPPGEGVYCPAVEQRVTPADCEDLTRADAEVRPGAAAFNVPDPMRRGETFEVHLVIDRRSPKEIRIIEEPISDDPTALNGMGDDPEAKAKAGAETGEDPAANAGTPVEDAPPDSNMTGVAKDSAPTPGQVVDRLEGTAERFYPKVGRHMRAELVGQGFDVVAKSEASQQIPLGGNATWIWSVTARKGGPQQLTLITVVEGVAEGRRFVLARTPTVRTITVEVSLRDRIWDTLTAAPNWIKAVTAVIAALGSLLTAWYALPWFRRRGEKDEAPRKTDRPDGKEE